MLVALVRIILSSCDIDDSSNSGDLDGREHNTWSVMLLKFYTYYDLENMYQTSDVYFEESKIYEKFLSL
jgi:hypothetical protein